MAPLTTASRALARSAARSCRVSPASPVSRVARAAALSTTAVRADASSSSSYESPFKAGDKTGQIPEWGHYLSKNPGSTNLLFQYFMVGTMGAIAAAGAKSTIHGE